MEKFNQRLDGSSTAYNKQKTTLGEVVRSWGYYGMLALYPTEPIETMWRTDPKEYDLMGPPAIGRHGLSKVTARLSPLAGALSLLSPLRSVSGQARSASSARRTLQPVSDCMLLGLGLLHAHVLLLGCAGAPAARGNGFICNGRTSNRCAFFTVSPSHEVNGGRVTISVV